MQRGEQAKACSPLDFSLLLGHGLHHATGAIHRHPDAVLQTAGGIARSHQHGLAQQQAHRGGVALGAALLADDGGGIPQIRQQFIGGIWHHQYVAGVELLRHLLHAAAHAQRAGGRPAAYAHCIHQ